MTFIPATSNNVSTLNSTSSTLTASSVYIGTSEDVARYSSITITVKSDVDSASLGVKLEFSTDNTNWDVVHAYTYLDEKPYDTWTVKVTGRYFRARYENGGSGQTVFRLQTRFEVSSTSEQKIQQQLPLDAFNRVRVSDPFTLITNNAVDGKRPFQVYEDITGSATSVHDTNASHITMATTGTGSVLRRNRKRAIYQPGKSLLIYMTGVLNNGSNAATVTSKIGYFDEDDGYYFQFNNDVISVVERSSVTGSVVETIVNQVDWNKNNVDGTNNKNYILDPSKAVIFWFNIEWLGVGFAECGIIINGELIPTHRFIHSNLLTTPYIATASLPPTYEIISTGGAGSMTSICQTVISEGGFLAAGKEYSANMGTSTKGITGIEPLIVLRMKTGVKVQAFLKNISVISTSNANALIELWKFVDTTAASILNNSTFISADINSSVEYNVAATTITVTAGALLASAYISNNNDTITISAPAENGTISNTDGSADLIAICATSLGANENFAAALTWTELI